MHILEVISIVLMINSLSLNKLSLDDEIIPLIRES
jgi:hypothetical protein